MLERDEICAEKAALRKQISEKLHLMSSEELENSNRMIRRLLQDSAIYKAAKSIFIYVSMNREPDTRDLITMALSDGKKVFVPKCGEPPHMNAVRINRLDELVPGRMGIMEPLENGDENTEIDLAVIPCVSVSPVGERLGRGGGYYDRFLNGRSVFKVCLCHDSLISVHIPVAEHDVRMDAVVTSGGLVFCG